MDAQEKKKKEKPKTKDVKGTAKTIMLREGETLKELSEKMDIKTKDINRGNDVYDIFFKRFIINPCF